MQGKYNARQRTINSPQTHDMGRRRQKNRPPWVPLLALLQMALTMNVNKNCSARPTLTQNINKTTIYPRTIIRHSTIRTRTGACHATKPHLHQQNTFGQRGCFLPGFCAWPLGCAFGFAPVFGSLAGGGLAMRWSGGVLAALLGGRDSGAVIRGPRFDGGVFMMALLRRCCCRAMVLMLLRWHCTTQASHTQVTKYIPKGHTLVSLARQMGDKVFPKRKTTK